MAKKPQAVTDTPETVAGRALIDLPDLGVLCGDYITLPAEDAERLNAAGAFDPLAKKPDEQ